MTTLTTLTVNPAKKPDFTREPRWGRPLIVPPGGGRAVAYTRVTTLAKTLEEQSALAAWKQRMTLIGASMRPDIVLSAAAHRDDKDQLNTLAEQAMEAAQAGAKATIGTAIHAITETLDLGGSPGAYPDEFKSTVDAYCEATEGMRFVAVEQALVCDELQVAGTADRIIQLPDGRHVIGDLKTGSIDYAGLSIACQLAVYAHSLGYDTETGQRFQLPPIDQHVGIVIHLPAGDQALRGTCELYEVDLAKGWEVARRSLQTRETRRYRGWFRPFVMPELASVEDPPAAPTRTVEPMPTIDQLADWISRAPGTAQLAELWQLYGPMFTAHPELDELAGARRVLIERGLASNPAASQPTTPAA